MTAPGGLGDAHEPDRFVTDDAAYLLGLLDVAERAAFETHLASCPDCAARVAALAPTVPALGQLAPTDWGALDEPALPVPSTLLPRLHRAVARRRTRLRAALVTSVAVAAAAIAALLIVVLGPDVGGSPSPPAAVPATMSAVANTPIRATVALAKTSWGTRISVTCSYRAAHPATSDVYILQVTDATGARHRLGSWTQTGQQIRFASGIALPRSKIHGIQVALPDGKPVLTLPIH